MAYTIRGVSAKGVPFSGLTYINCRGFTSTPLQEAKRDVPLEGVAFSRLD